MHRIQQRVRMAALAGVVLWVGVGGTAGTARAQTPQSCAPATAESFLNANDVRAKLLNNGGLFWNGGANIYEVPAGGGKTVVFAAGLWLGGFVDGQLRTAGTTFGPWEFWPGPYDAVAAGGDCASFDTIFEVTRRDLAALNAGGEPSAHVINWPWQLGAPVQDGDGNPDNYDLAAGDRPQLYGDEMHWWVMNDIGNEHTWSGTPPLGLEVQVIAFATAADGEEKTTFYQYTVINKSTNTIQDMRLGMFADTDIGNRHGDAVGSDSALGMGYTYKAWESDPIFGMQPPAVGFQFISGKKYQPLSSVVYFVSGAGSGSFGDPNEAQDVYNLLDGLQTGGQDFTIGGVGESRFGSATKFLFPADPVSGDFWSFMNIDGAGNRGMLGDIRLVQSTGPVDVAPGDSIEVYIGIVTAFGDDHLDAVTRLKNKAAGLLGRTPESIPRSAGTGQPITIAPEIQNVGPYAERQPVDIDLMWVWDGPETLFQIEIMPVGRPERVRVLEALDRSIPLDLEPHTMYSARVRAMDRFTYGPWSESIIFSTGQPSVEISPINTISITANAAGPLTLPVMGALSIDGNGFPMADGQGRPPTGSQTTGATWVLHTGRSSDSGVSGDYETFLGRSILSPLSVFLRSDLEIRFTENCWSAWEEAQLSGETVVAEPAPTGCYAYDRFGQYDGNSLQTVPFEVWWSGRGTPDDASDDVRLILAGRDMELDGWGMQADDHPVSGGADDPQTDWVYVFLPTDVAPGETGHDAWLETLVETCYQMTGTCTPDAHEREVIRRLVFVNVDSDVSSPMPEAGTVFRIEVARVPGPAPGAPSRGQLVSTNQPTFYWEGDVFAADVLQIALDEEFEQVFFEVEGARSGEVVAPVLGAGTYYWRVSNEIGTFSEPVPFFVASNVEAEEDPAIPSDVALTSVYPNPFRDRATIAFSLSEVGPARIDLFDALGRRVRTVQDTVLPAGYHTVPMDAAALPAGLYLLRLTAGGVTSTRTLILTH